MPTLYLSNKNKKYFYLFYLAYIVIFMGFLKIFKQFYIENNQKISQCQIDNQKIMVSLQAIHLAQKPDALVFLQTQKKWLVLWKSIFYWGNRPENWLELRKIQLQKSHLILEIELPKEHYLSFEKILSKSPNSLKVEKIQQIDTHFLFTLLQEKST